MSKGGITESEVEQAVLSWFEELVGQLAIEYQ
jgi:hypothetical protein